MHMTVDIYFLKLLRPAKRSDDLLVRFADLPGVPDQPLIVEGIFERTASGIVVNQGQGVIDVLQGR